MQLRPYQNAAVEAVYQHLRTRDDHPCVVIPTAGGKTPVIATICKDAVGRWNGRVLILAHVKELLQQAADKLHAVCPEVRFGVYSAGLKRRDTLAPVIIAGIQSIYRQAREFDAFDLVIIDEAHMIPPDGDGMYRQFLADAKAVNPHLRIIGFTATPFRLKTGSICSPDGILNAICFNVDIRELIRDGYLCPLITKAGINKVDTSRLRVRGGEYVAGEVEDLMDEGWLVEAACGETIGYTQNRKSVLIFASGVKHGEHVVNNLREKHAAECGFVCGETPDDKREALLTRFKRGELKFLCNVNVLTTGFDAPNIDCVVLLRPTLSPGLYYQMVGRGFRLHPSKQNCLVLDFGGNVMRHGPVDQIRVCEVAAGATGPAPAKECPECLSVIAAGYARCPDCGYEFPPPQRQKHEGKASDVGILAGQVSVTKYVVRDVFYTVHHKKGAPDDAPKTMRVDYLVALNDFKSEWVCFEHTGYARQKAVGWWRRHSHDPVPTTAQQAVDIANNGGLAVPTSITVRAVAGDDFERITDYKLGPLPEPAFASEPIENPSREAVPEDEIPF